MSIIDTLLKKEENSEKPAVETTEMLVAPAYSPILYMLACSSVYGEPCMLSGQFCTDPIRWINYLCHDGGAVYWSKGLCLDLSHLLACPSSCSQSWPNQKDQQSQPVSWELIYLEGEELYWRTEFHDHSFPCGQESLTLTLATLFFCFPWLSFLWGLKHFVPDKIFDMHLSLEFHPSA